VEGYVLVVSGAENMWSPLSDVFSPVPAFFKRIDVENFKNIGETEECLFKPLADKERRAFDRACIGDIHAITNGTPYEINLIAHHMYRIWKDGKNPKVALFPAVWDDVLKEIDGASPNGQQDETVWGGPPGDLTIFA
jgi:hypothetical protein